MDGAEARKCVWSCEWDEMKGKGKRKGRGGCNGKEGEEGEEGEEGRKGGGGKKEGAKKRCSVFSLTPLFVSMGVVWTQTTRGRGYRHEWTNEKAWMVMPARGQGHCQWTQLQQSRWKTTTKKNEMRAR